MNHRLSVQYEVSGGRNLGGVASIRHGLVPVVGVMLVWWWCWQRETVRNCSRKRKPRLIRDCSMATISASVASVSIARSRGEDVEIKGMHQSNRMCGSLREAI